MNESRLLLEAERKLRLKLEEQIHALEAQLQLQIEVPDIDASEITAHILGRKPNPPQKSFKVCSFIHQVSLNLLSCLSLWLLFRLCSSFLFGRNL